MNLQGTMSSPDAAIEIDSLSPRVRGMRPSATLAINERSAELQRQGRKVYRLGFGQSPFPVPPAVVEELRLHAYRKDYLPVRGLGELREAVADHHRRLHGVSRSGDDVLIGPGSKELMFLLQLVFEGDLLLPSPSWVSYEPQARLTGRTVHWIPTRRENRWALQPEDLDRVCRLTQGRPGILILNYPNNPTGLSFRGPELEALAAVAREHRLLVLSDEIYGELHHSGGHASIAVHYPEGTILSSGLSKWCGAGGWRLGTFTFPAELRRLADALAVAASETYTSASAPVQCAAVRAFRGGPEIDRYLRAARRILSMAGLYTACRLREAGVAVSDPDGAFYLFPDFTAHSSKLHARGIRTGERFCERLLEETGVALLPGADFGRPAEEFTARLAYVDFDGAACLAAAEPCMAEHCPNLIQAMDIIQDWLAR